MSMDNWLETTVCVNGIEKNYIRTGSPLPTIVLLHGITDDGYCWYRLSNELQHKYDLIMVYTRGHGKSSKAVPYSNLLMADDAAALKVSWQQ